MRGAPVTEIEFLYSARSAEKRVEPVTALEELLGREPSDDRAVTRAWEVQQLLTARGEHRSAGAVDLMVGATAELRGLTVLHFGRDFETIAGATGQPTQRLIPPGTA